jgi:hypothetical protein
MHFYFSMSIHSIICDMCETLLLYIGKTEKIDSTLRETCLDMCKSECFDFSISKFMIYVNKLYPECRSSSEYISLRFYVKIWNSPKGKFEIGDKVTYKNEDAYVTDYMHELNLYEVRRNSSIIFNDGWIKDTELELIE